MDRENGKAEPIDSHLPLEALAPLISRLAELAKEGPYPPLGALTSPERCQTCGFFAQCYVKSELSPLALEF